MMNGLTGLEYLTSVMQQTIPHAPMHELMHMKIAAVEYGKISYEFVPQPCHINLQGGIHGGYYASILDSVTGGAGHSTIEANQKIVTIDLNTKMLRPLQVGQCYKGIDTLVNRGREIIVTEGQIVDDKVKLYAHGTAILKVLL